MGQVKQSILSIIISSRPNYFNRTKSFVSKCLIFVSKVSSKLYAQPRPPLKYFTEMQEHSQNNHFLVVGLGNYGFDKTRHSVGMKAVDVLANKLNVKWETYDGFISSTKLDHIRITLFKPKALMNVNGGSVGRIVHQLSLKPANVYLIHDELDRTPGTFHLKEGGSAGGHNGILSCMESLGSKDMKRLRIGIGRPTTKALVAPYVLSSFSKEEKDSVDVAIQLGLHSLLDHIKQRSSQPSLAKSAATVPGPTVCEMETNRAADLKPEPLGSIDAKSSVDSSRAERKACVRDKELTPDR